MRIREEKPRGGGDAIIDEKREAKNAVDERGRLKLTRGSTGCICSRFELLAC
jgi:hypothetical protein